MAIGAHLLEPIRHLHPFGGPLLAFIGSLPILKIGRPGGLRVREAVKNREFSPDLTASKPYRPEATRILTGDPVQTVTYLFASGDKRLTVGLWTCQVGSWRIEFAEHEFIHIIAGVVAVTDAEGDKRVYRAGDAFVSPAGFAGTWDVIEPVTKHFVVYNEPT